MTNATMLLYNLNMLLDTEKLLNTVKEKGGRITKTRRLLFSVLIKSGQPLSSSEILSKLKKDIPSLNRSTIYRELMFLCSNDILKEVMISGRPPLYEVASGHCHHLVCKRCQKVKAIEMDKHLEEAEKKIGRQEGFKITDHSLEFYGLCSECRE